MLQTGLEHIQSDADFQTLLDANKNVMICCGRMGPMCLPVYDVMENLEEQYEHVTFRDMAFDSPVAAATIRRLPQVQSFRGLPFTVYFKEGQVVAATSSIQRKAEVKAILDEHFSA